eukprot:TRINITY_DN70_c1_g1_i4.p1 TRINITY_DN70_c1_g1~~TRINITY_DN70_c1_g1_i4.p1  ORF type:complete len:473 (-),score=137.52 TRINITY_DN70_c1_g1_i4:86-1504(-)
MSDKNERRSQFSRTKTKIQLEVETTEKTEEEQKGELKFEILENIIFGILVLLIEIIFLAIYAVWFDYPEEEEAEHEFDYFYNLFRDVNIMIFFGFGFLMTFLRRYGFSAIGYTLFTSVIVCQWSIILETFFFEVHHDTSFAVRRPIGLEQLLNGLFCSGTVMISYGAVLGKVGPLQMLVLGILEPIPYWLNFFINALKLETVDIGGGYYIHMFGAYFGLAMCFFITSKATHGHQDNTSNYSSDIFSFAGTLFLWLLWPSFNAVIAPAGIQRIRAVVNTFLSLCGATASTFLMSRLVSGGKFDAVHIQNATLAGGVTMGIAAHLKLYPATALGCGLVSGVISVFGYRVLTPLLSRFFHIQDVCGVHNLHGLPSIWAAIISVFATLILSQTDTEKDILPQGDWQPAFQLSAIGITLGIAVLFGSITGLILFLISWIHRIHKVDYFNDRFAWHLPSDYNWVASEGGDGEEDNEDL